MDAELLLNSVVAGGAIALVVAGAAVGLLSSNAIKRLAGLSVAGLGAVASVAVFGAPEFAVTAGVAVVFAQLAVGVAIVVRLQESYAGIEAADIDRADAQSEHRDAAS